MSDRQIDGDGGMPRRNLQQLLLDNNRTPSPKRTSNHNRPSQTSSHMSNKASQQSANSVEVTPPKLGQSPKSAHKKRRRIIMSDDDEEEEVEAKRIIMSDDDQQEGDEAKIEKLSDPEEEDDEESEDSEESGGSETEYEDEDEEEEDEEEEILQIRDIESAERLDRIALESWPPELVLRVLEVKEINASYDHSSRKRTYFTKVILGNDETYKIELQDWEDNLPKLIQYQTYIIRGVKVCRIKPQNKRYNEGNVPFTLGFYERSTFEKCLTRNSDEKYLPVKEMTASSVFQKMAKATRFQMYPSAPKEVVLRVKNVKITDTVQCGYTDRPKCQILKAILSNDDGIEVELQAWGQRHGTLDSVLMQEKVYAFFNCCAFKIVPEQKEHTGGNVPFTLSYQQQSRVVQCQLKNDE